MKKLFNALLVVVLSAQFVWATSSTFNATTSRVGLVNFAAIQIKTFTMGCWINRTGTGENSEGHIADRGFGSNGWKFTYNRGGAARISFSADFSTTDGFWRETDAPAGTGTWEHHAVAPDLTGLGQPAFFKNGVSIGVTTDQTPVGTNTAGTGDFSIGNDGFGDRTWDGRLADCFFYSRNLVANEVKQIMNFGPNSLKNGLVCYWPLGAFVGFHAGGSSGASCNGTFTANTISATGPPVSAAQGAFSW